MKSIGTLAFALTAGLLLNPVVAQEKLELNDMKSKASYSIGMSLGNQFRSDEVDVDLNILFRGIRDAFEGKTTALTEKEMVAVMNEFRQQVRAHLMERRRQQGEKNRTEGERFLSENKTKPGVVTLPSGLQYKILTEGSGAPPKSNDLVTVNYRGTLIDGTEFDSSYTNGQPATFRVSGVIKGWTEAIQLMKPGAKWQLYIPSELAYADRGKGAKIGPNATLLFDVELLSFTNTPPPTPPANMPQVVTSDIIKVPSKEEMDKGAKPEVIKKEDAERLIREQQQKKDAEQKAAEKK